MKKHQIRIYSIKIKEFEKKKHRATENFKYQNNDQKRKKKLKR